MNGMQVEGGEKKSLVPSHRDSYPFVCVVMLSNAEYMTDGETELGKGDGTTMKVRAPKMVRIHLARYPRGIFYNLISC